MAAPITPIAQVDFSGGMNAVSSPYLVGPKQVALARNLILDEHGALRTRPGSVLVTHNPIHADPIRYVGILTLTNGSVALFAVQPVGGINRMWRINTFSDWTHIGDFETSYETPTSVTVVDKEFIAAGYEVPKLFDGNVLVPITAQGDQSTPPGARHVAFHLGSIWLWNTAATTTALDGPSSLRMSDVNDPNSWPTSHQTFVAKDDGQEGMGMATFTIAETGIAPTQTLVLFKNYSAYQVTGVFGSANFAIQKVKTDMGCVAPRTISFVSGFGIIRLTHKGFALFNGVDDRLISEEIRPFVFGGVEPSIAPINQASAVFSWAAQSQNPPLYVAACPVEGTSLTRVFVYDLVRRSWTICDFPFPITTMSLITIPTQAPVIWAGTASGGEVKRIFGEDTTDQGTPVSWAFTSRNYFVGSFMRPAYWRRAILHALVPSNQDVHFTLTLRGIPGTVTASRTFEGASPEALWGTGVWGTMVWGGDPESVVDASTDIDVMRTTPSLNMEVSGEGPVRIRGIELHARPKPPTRMRG